MEGVYVMDVPLKKDAFNGCVSIQSAVVCNFVAIEAILHNLGAHTYIVP